MAASVCSAETRLLGQAQALPIGIEPSPWARWPEDVSTSITTSNNTTSVTTRPPNLIGVR